MGKKLIFRKLTPLTDADISTYEEAIDYALQNNDIRNVAISGAYGAGKSSVLESYKAKHDKCNFVHISLAHFHDPEQESETQGVPVKEAVLEGKILNQLIHQIPSEKIPQTNFKVKRKNDEKQSKRMTAFISILLCCIVYLWSFSNVSAFVDALEQNWVKCILFLLYNSYAAIFIALVCAGLIVAAIYLLIQAQKNKNIFQKISLQGNEIELFSNQDDSFFDKYLNEVLYLFDNVEADVIVFEDMDRFNANQIFERLREVNALINVQRKKEQGDAYKPLRFFYLLRDDIFETKDRTKFFDYIIPIVPVVDGSNSYEKFVELLREAEILEKFDMSFLQSLCLYIDDMRVLKNVYNEFVVYYNRLNNTELNCNKMMAMIVYKNLFPRDHSELQLGRGFVAALFAQRESLNDSTIQELENKRQALVNRIEQVQKEHFNSDEELDFYYDRRVEQLKSPYRGWLPDSVSAQVKELEAARKERKQILQDGLLENREKIESQIVDIERKVASVKTGRFKDLITRENIGSVFAINTKNEIGVVQKFEDIKGSAYFNLLKFLIRNGYIDETYSDYMTYFYEGSITQNDKIFLRRITDRRGAAYDYSLRDPQKVIESSILGDAEFGQEETLNYDLLEFLLLNAASSSYVRYLDILLGQIRETKNFDFISKFYNTEKANAEFVVKLNEQWPSFFITAKQAGVFPLTQLRKFSIDTMYYAEKDLIEQVNMDGCLTTYISATPDFLNIEKPNIERLISSFLLLKVSFLEIDYPTAEKNLFDAVYKNNLYKLSFENIELMLRKIYCIEDDNSITHQNYTTIQRDPTSPLLQYIVANFSKYVQIVLEHCDGVITDTEDCAISLLNSADIDAEMKTKYIAVLTTEIGNISEVADSALWQFLLSRRIVAATVENLVYYFDKCGMDVHLINYINTLPEGLDYSIVKNIFGEDVADKLDDSVAECNDLTDEKYRDMLVGLGYHFTSFSKEDLVDGKMDILIQQGLLRMNEGMLEFIRENYESHLYAFIRANLDEYLALQTGEIFKLKEAEEVIGWEFDDEKKISLLKHTTKPISVVGKNYTDIVVAYILSNNYAPEDMADLCTGYSHYGNETKKEIMTLAEGRIEDIVDNELVLDSTLLSALFKSDNVTVDDKIRLFSNALSDLNEETCKEHFAELGVSELNGIFMKGGGRRNYAKSKIITGILEVLQEHGWIYEYKDDERNSERYLVIKNPPKKNMD